MSRGNKSMTDHRPLNATAASLLGFLHDGPMTGYELAAMAQRVIGDFWSLTQSQVYRELAWMAEAGFVTAGERGTRDRRPYALGEPGRAAFAEWVVRPPGAETIRHPLLLAISFGRHIPRDRMAAFIRQHREAHAERLHVYATQAASEAGDEANRDPFLAATLAFGIAYERAVMDWFDGLPQAIRDPTDEPSAGR
jgi:DNA-binding PadR family transcriptional regulator